MPRRLNLPDSASVAVPDGDGRMFAPSAQRNAPDIAALLVAHAPVTGRMLEIASGTGEHAVYFAARLPQLVWQPTEVDPARMASIAAHAALAGLPNLRAAVMLDATAAGWGAGQSGQDMVLLVNLLHLVSEPEARTLIGEVAQALAVGGRFVLYGPFLRGGETTSAGDARFHASLRAQDPEIGYKNDRDVIEWLDASGLDLVQTVQMPANNLAFISKRSV